MGFRFLPYKKAKKGVQIAGVDYDDSGGGGGSYTLPPATASTLGGIKVGSNLSVESDGTLSGSAPYTLPTASSEVLGGVKVGSGLSITDGVLSAIGGGSTISVIDVSIGQLDQAGKVEHTSVDGAVYLILYARDIPNLPSSFTPIGVTFGYNNLLGGGYMNYMNCDDVGNIMMTGKSGFTIASNATVRLIITT